MVCKKFGYFGIHVSHYESTFIALIEQPVIFFEILEPEIGEFLNSIGLPTLQGYGLTETSPVVSCNPIHKIKVETVGPPFKGNKVKIAKDGEILVKGENVMLGYWNKKEETEKTYPVC